MSTIERLEENQNHEGNKSTERTIGFIFFSLLFCMSSYLMIDANSVGKAILGSIAMFSVSSLFYGGFKHGSEIADKKPDAENSSDTRKAK